MLLSQNEQTESREDLAKRCGSDPESTEEIKAASNAAERVLSAAGACTITKNDGAAVAARLAGVASKANGHQSFLEVTYPIELPRADGAQLDTSFNIHIADDQDNPAELVELVVERHMGRTSVVPGETLAGRYVIIEKVDHCGMGLVYKALDRRREKAGLPVPWVALKFATGKAWDSSTTSSYLRQEFLKLSQLSHPNIVSVYDFDSDGGLEFIVMEWLEGQTLANLLLHITSKRIALGKAEEIVRSVGSALAHAHELGIVHGDVKASNIFLTENRSVKLLDFGASASGHPSADGTEPNWATRAYASCAVLHGDAPQPHDDVFALGVTAYCLLSGERPFGDLDAAEAKEQGIVPSPLPADAQGCWPAVEHALRLDACDRPANAGEFLLEFSDPPAEVEATAERSQLEQIAYGAIAIALIIAFVAWTAGSVGGVPAGDAVILDLDDADQAFEAGRLVNGGDNSAFTLYSSVLEVAPDAPRALEGIQRIAEHYLTLARDALAADDPEAAAANLAIARDVMPQHYGIAITGDLIARYGKDLLVSARDIAGSDLEQAERLLARAGGFLPADDPALVQVQADFAQYRKDAELDLLLQGIDQRILAERLTVPQQDSAVELLRKARQLAPRDRQVLLAADRVATALLFQSMFAISSGKLDDAERFINAAEALNVKHLALARAQYELAKARHAAVRTQSAAGG
ncbi:MAG TPA: serine/threonine-protein kinase [Woeseiaceae bacterium]